MKYSLNIREVTYALSGALDFVGIDDTLHGKRVAYMAAELAKELSWDKTLIDDIIFTGMLHDCGVSSTDVHTHLVTELDWDNSQVHSIRGEGLLKTTKTYGRFSTYVRYHHTHWQDLPDTLSQREKEVSNLIYLVDRIDALNAQMKNSGIRSIRSMQETVNKYSGIMFSPKLVEGFMTISARDSFWFYLENEALEEYFLEWIEKGFDKDLSFEEIKEISLMFAAVVDAKSTFTSEHSISVSSLSRYLADLFELPKESCEKIELAALLHDLGKLRVDDAILDKPSKLNTDERLIMNRHGFDSFIILRHIKGFKEIAHLASLHHETLDAKGYPYNLSASDIPIEARIITVADIFQALIQDRPYRAGLDMNEAYDILYRMCEDGKLDFAVVEMLKEHLQSCYEKARIKYEILQS
ncbi:HD domain-containing phosphohydrolase [Sulfurimonas sp. HSL-1716]|uniref:HD-GYP domain-containing protein n=1 Tax=Hydrocurvibacter sulfurireducens TaxID=3131937 RepID=UPI0031F79D1C